MNQSEKILDYIRENGSITPLDALREFGCMRLASRISDLKHAGPAYRALWKHQGTRKARLSDTLAIR